ncbi:MAG TPA: SRPBCC family protein [Thermoleophilia bacterium]|nr:SRPBCC family protein [Thermoleophilia bacterium]
MADVQISAPPGVPQIVTAVEFDAPRYLVFRAFMEPDLLAQWLGPRRVTMTIEEYDPRDGGRYRYTHHDPDGNTYSFRGVFHGEPSLEGAVQTFEYEGAPGHVSLDTLTLEEQGGRTTVRTNSVFQAVEDRDAMVQAGMEKGVTEGMQRLEELLEKLKKQGEGGASRAT